MSRNRYIVSYDIRDDYRLRQVHKVVVGFGVRLQYSVYLADLSQTELIALKWRLRDEIHASEDSVAIIDLGPPNERGTNCFEFMGVAPMLPVDGSATII